MTWPLIATAAAETAVLAAVLTAYFSARPVTRWPRQGWRRATRRSLRHSRHRRRCRSLRRARKGCPSYQREPVRTLPAARTANLGCGGQTHRCARTIHDLNTSHCATHRFAYRTVISTDATTGR